MNNLLRTLTESQVKPSADLRLLLTSVKEGRKQGLEQKLTDGFYDSLEGLLNDLRTITIDNRDAEAFLRPVARSEVPDYYDVIVTPMDFQTMLRKVKSKQYKSKREFQDDLDLIWSNCYTYNAAENHPLRRCVDRLKVKAEKLLKYITDRKERTDPPLPSNLPQSTTGIARPRMTNGLNGHLNGYGSHSRSSSITSKPNTPTSSTFFGGGARLGAKRMGMGADVLFSEMPALVRTQEGMKLYMELEDALDSDTQGPEGDLAQRLRALATFVECEDENGGSPDPAMKIEDGMDIDDALTGVGEKRKQNGFMDKRPKKRAKLINPYPMPLSDEKDEVTQLWWAAIQSDLLIANAVPAIPFGPSSSKPRKPKKKKVKQPIASTSSANGLLSSPVKGKKTTIVKKEQEDTSLSALQTPPPPPTSISASASMSGIPTQSQSQASVNATAGPSNPKSILAMMNTNIKTMRRVRHTHSKFLALNATSAAVDDEEGGIGGAGAGDATDGVGLGGLGGSGGSISTGMGFGMTGASSPTAAHFAALDDEVVNDRIDEAPWSVGRGFEGPEDARRRRRKEKGKDKMVVDSGESVSQIQRPQGSGIPVSGIELGERNANDCMRWAGGKVLEHVGFQGTSKMALDVFADLTAQYLQNVGRTMRFLTDKFGHTMSPEEIMLHTLFESGTSKVQDLERFISDDIERYGNRLGELEKKLVNAYRDATASDVLEDEGLFEEEDEDEVGALAIGEFADFAGDDFFGLGELGIAAELGLSALTVPKRLLKGKKGANKPTAAKPMEPPPPYPPPPPFVPLTAAKVEDQIGLLQAFYTERFKTLAASAPPPPPPIVQMGGLPSLPGPVLLPPPLAGPMIPGISAPPAGALTPAVPTPAPPPNPPTTAPEPALPPNTLPSTSAIGPAPPVAPPSPIVPPDLVLPDDGPTTAQMKMAPLGQITRPSGMGAKKKGAAAAAAAAAAASGGADDKKKTNGIKASG